MQESTITELHKGYRRYMSSHMAWVRVADVLAAIHPMPIHIIDERELPVIVVTRVNNGDLFSNVNPTELHGKPYLRIHFARKIEFTITSVPG